MWNPSRGVFHSDDAWQTKLASDDRPVRKHAPALDDESRDEAEHRTPAWIRLPGHQNVSAGKSCRFADIAEDRGSRYHTAAACCGARHYSGHPVADRTRPKGRALDYLAEGFTWAEAERIRRCQLALQGML